MKLLCSVHNKIFTFLGRVFTSIHQLYQILGDYHSSFLDRLHINPIFRGMNFLSHYYFDRLTTDANVVMGTVLPDLIKNASKEANLYPQKKEYLFKGHRDEESLLNGWKRHLAVDLIFHSSTFFLEKTTELKQLIKPIVENTLVRPSFLAHIGLELLLDHLLVEQNLVKVNQFYGSLNAVKKDSLTTFLKHCGMADSSVFFNFLERFISSKYLLSYQKLENISYALNRICMRLWPSTMSDFQLQELTFQLGIFKQALEKDFMRIFEDIEENPLFNQVKNS